MMRRTPMKRTAFRGSSRTSSFARRPRHVPYMLWVKTLPCWAAAVNQSDPCWGPVEADHAGDRFSQGDGKRPHDSTCIPLCTRHHDQRHHFAGAFKDWDGGRMRVWLDERIRLTQAIARGCGVVVPAVPKSKVPERPFLHVRDPELFEEPAPLPVARVVTRKRKP